VTPTPRRRRAPKWPDSWDKCVDHLFPDLAHGVTCADCSALVDPDQFRNKYKTCNAYCEAAGSTCDYAYGVLDLTCNVINTKVKCDSEQSSKDPYMMCACHAEGTPEFGTPRRRTDTSQYRRAGVAAAYPTKWLEPWPDTSTVRACYELVMKQDPEVCDLEMFTYIIHQSPGCACRTPVSPENEKIVGNSLYMDHYEILTPTDRRRRTDKLVRRRRYKGG
jgi:hypothetical protein